MIDYKNSPKRHLRKKDISHITIVYSPFHESLKNAIFKSGHIKIKNEDEKTFFSKLYVPVSVIKSLQNDF